MGRATHRRAMLVRTGRFARYFAAAWLCVLSYVASGQGLSDEDALVLFSAEDFQRAIEGFDSVDEAVNYTPPPDPNSTLLAGPPDTDGPIIEVISPATDSSVCRPADFEIRWRPKTVDASIDLTTLIIKASVGLISRNLTDKLREMAKRPGAKLDTDGVLVPATMGVVPERLNKVKVSVRIGDSMQRHTTKRFVLHFGAC